LQEVFLEFFGSFAKIIVFLHIVSATILIGGLFVLRFVIKPILMTMEDEEDKFQRCLKILDRYAKILLPVMLILISASLMMTIGLGFEYASPITYTLIHVKEALWLFIAFNFVYMYWKLLGARKAYKKYDYFEVKENIILIVNCLVPLNLILALIAVFVGVTIRGF
jgi:uncharacterized membrane protein